MTSDQDIDAAVRDFDGDSVLTGSFDGTVGVPAARRIEADRAVFLIDGCPALDMVFDGARLRDVRLTRCQLDGSTFHKAVVHPKSRLDVRGSNLDRVAGLLGIGAVLVDSAQSVPIGALLLAERRVEISDEPPPAPR